MKKLKIGLPKGSLEATTFELFSKAGFNVSVEERAYFPYIDDPELEGILIRAQEIAPYVEQGVIDIGLTGHDWVEETEADVEEICELVYAKRGFSKIRWVLAVHADSELTEASQLEGKRIATELVNVTKKYLTAKGVKAQVEYSWGATEAKVPALADAIVEATETGSSLKANNLREVDTVLSSSTRLIANPQSLKDDWKRFKIENLATLLQGALRAQGMVGLKMNVARKDMAPVLEILPALRNPTISPLSDENFVAIEVIAEEKVVRDLIPKLKRCGATGIIEYPLNKVIP